ncbi:MAG: hypothetical protein MR006_05665 [Arcanobacterium sp.]|nr:hypothetical protein [Arcanobacterium sp.]MDY5588499.1 hypothetical protein [Arcanobacterium sp.]
MRIYIPVNLADMTATDISARRVHGVTPAAQEAFPESDREGLEMLATLYAADEALLMLRVSAEQNAALDRADFSQLRRIVAVGEVPDTWVEVVPSEVPTALALHHTVPWSKIESIHIDEAGSEELVLQAIRGNRAAFEATGDIELLWYDVSERVALIHELENRHA